MSLPQSCDPSEYQSLPPVPPCQEEQSDAIPTDPGPLNDILALGLDSPIYDLKKTAQFICTLQGATLEKSNMQQEDINCLCATDPDPRIDITDKHFEKALCAFLLTTNASQSTYNALCFLMIECYPEDPFLSFGQMRWHVEQLSGVIPISYDMCPDTCIGFTSPLVDCETCPICGKDCYQSGTHEPHQQFITVLLGPVI